MSPFIEITKPAGTEWTPIPGGHRVTIRREAEVYFVENPAAYLGTQFEQAGGQQQASYPAGPHNSAQAMDIRST